MKKAPDKPADPIIVHPDIRRKLMTMKAFNEAGRALALWTALQSDIAHRSPDEKERQAALSLLIDSELSQQYGAANGIEPPRAELSNALAQNQQTVNALPEDLREDFSDLLRTYVEAQLIVQEAGREAAGPDAGPEQLAAAGIQQRNEWLAEEDVEVELDPRFGEYQDGGIDGSGGSLSIPVSDRAAAGDSTEPSPEWVADLPLSQKCG